MSAFISAAWESSCGSGRLCQGVVPEDFSVVTQLCRSSGFSPPKGMSLLFPATLQLWSFLLAVELAPVGSVNMMSNKKLFVFRGLSYTGGLGFALFCLFFLFFVFLGVPPQV